MILVTGGAGYIGSVLVGYLLKSKYSVRIIDTLWFGRDSLSMFKGEIELVKGDIRRPPRGIFKNVTEVIHLAGFSNDPTANFDTKTNFEINTLATISFAKEAKKMGVKKFIFGSSCSIYDRGFVKRISILDEKVWVLPKTAYSLSKYKAENSLLEMADSSFCVTVVRKGTVYGYSTRMRYDLVVNTMIKDALSKDRLNVLGGGIQFRPLISVDDVSRGYLLFLKADSKKINKNVFNLLSKNYRIIDVARLVKKGLPGKSNMVINVSKVLLDRRNYKVSNKKIIKVLGFRPTDDITSVVKNTITQIKMNRKDDFDNFNYYNIEWMHRRYEKQKYL